MTTEVSWMKERGVLPSQWLENHPDERDLLFTIRQAFWPDYKRATRFRARVGMRWLGNAHLGLLGKVQIDMRAEALRRFHRVEAEMQLQPKPDA